MELLEIQQHIELRAITINTQRNEQEKRTKVHKNELTKELLIKRNHMYEELIRRKS